MMKYAPDVSKNIKSSLLYKQAKSIITPIKDIKPPTQDDLNCKIHGNYIAKMFELFTEMKSSRRQEMYLGLLRIGHEQKEEMPKSTKTVSTYPVIDDSPYWAAEYWVRLHIDELERKKILFISYFLLFCFFLFYLLLFLRFRLEMNIFACTLFIRRMSLPNTTIISSFKCII
jgi:hypothetical protein